MAHKGTLKFQARVHESTMDNLELKHLYLSGNICLIASHFYSLKLKASLEKSWY